MFFTEPVRKMRFAAERPWTPVIRDEESVVAAKVPPTAIRSATVFVKIEASAPFLSTAQYGHAQIADFVAFRTENAFPYSTQDTFTFFAFRMQIVAHVGYDF